MRGSKLVYQWVCTLPLTSVCAGEKTEVERYRGRKRERLTSRGLPNLVQEGFCNKLSRLSRTLDSTAKYKNRDIYL